MDPIVGFVAAALRIATPLLWAALGETVAERAGVINLSVEGAMLVGCLAAAVGAVATGSPWLGLLLGAAAGGVVALVFGLITVWGRADQIIVGTAVTLATIGVTGIWHRQVFGQAGAGLTLPTFSSVAIPGLASIPYIGPALFEHPAVTYAGVLAVPLLSWLLFRTLPGLKLRATGEARDHAAARGVPVRWVQTIAVVVGGILAGVGGAALVLAQVGTFAERMTAGRGFIAIAIVVLGRWSPGGVLLASIGFGALTALQFVFQAMDLALPYQFFLMMPYLVALVALTGLVGRTRAPAQLGKG